MGYSVHLSTRFQPPFNPPDAFFEVPEFLVLKEVADRRTYTNTARVPPLSNSYSGDLKRILMPFLPQLDSTYWSSYTII